MIARILFIIFFLTSAFAFSQNKFQEITVVYFRELSEEELAKLIELKKLINPSKKKEKYQITLKNFYSDKTTKFNSEGDLYYLPKSIINKTYNEENEVIDKIKNFNATNILSFSSDLNLSSSLRYIGLFSNELQQLSKNIKKVKKGDLTLIWFNGFLPNKFSAENIRMVYDQNKKNGTLSQLIPVITNIKTLTRVIPVSNNYNFIFEPVEYFNSYQVILTYHDYNSGEDIEIFNEVIDTSLQSKDFKLSRQTGTNRYVLSIDNRFLGYKCYSLQKVNITTGVPGGDDCGECKDECLYNKEFSIRVRGYVNDFNAEDLWSASIEQFFLQCTFFNK
jgi:hypothetical protein